MPPSMALRRAKYFELQETGGPRGQPQKPALSDLLLLPCLLPSLFRELRHLNQNSSSLRRVTEMRTPCPSKQAVRLERSLSPLSLQYPHSRGVLPRTWEEGLLHRETKRTLSRQALLGPPRLLPVDHTPLSGHISTVLHIFSQTSA